jgi:Lon protease-like protein
MVEDCLERGPAAMAVTLLAPGWEEDYEGSPAIHTLAGAGRIVGHQPLPDGRHNILLEGLCRVRIEELDGGSLPYRVARAHVLSDTGEASASDVRALLACAAPVVAAVRREHPTFDLEVDADDAPGVVADRTADRLVADVTLRQRLIETLDVGERIEVVTEAVGELMAMLARRRQGQLLD